MDEHNNHHLSWLRTVVWSVVAALLVTVISLTIWIINDVNSPGPSTVEMTLVVAKGDGIRAVAGKLQDKKIIRQKITWVLFATLTGKRGSILPGDYKIPAEASGKRILELLSHGPDDNREVKVTVPEGYTLAEIAALLEKSGVTTAASFLSITKHPADVIANWPTDLFSSKPASVDLEGYLFPDTYYFFKDSAASVVVKKMLDNTDVKLSTEIRRQIVQSGRSIHQILTMASILQAELRTPNDQAMAADLFWRRIEKGMGLNADTTVLYALGRKSGSLTSTDLKVDSLYNTYKYKGLPPGPIDNPGLAAIKAAISPIANGYWYYLTAPSGQTIWAKTYDEHVANKRKYLAGS